MMKKQTNQFLKQISIPAALLGAVLLLGCNRSVVIEVPADYEKFKVEDEIEFEAYSEELWEDRSLSSNGKYACDTCHFDLRGFRKTFEFDYPHYVESAEQSVQAEQMVQLCYSKSMGNGHHLPWNSKELRALTEYTMRLQDEFQEKAKEK